MRLSRFLPLFLLIVAAARTTSAQECSAYFAEPESVKTAGSQPVTLRVNDPYGQAAGLQWYQGAPPDTSHPLGSSTSIIVSPTTPTYYWVDLGGGHYAQSYVEPSTCPYAPPFAPICNVPRFVCNKGVYTASVPADADPNAVYQWSILAPPIGATAQILSQSGPSITFTVNDFGTITSHARPAINLDLAVTNSCGSRFSSTLLIWGDDAPAPVITAPSTVPPGMPSDASVNPPESYPPNGTTPDDTYTWSIDNGTIISGQGTPAIRFSASGPGAVTLHVTVANACGSATASKTIVACVPPAIQSGPANTTIQAGSSATLTVTTSGTTPLTYQWYSGASGDTSHPVGGNTPALTITPATMESAYWVRVTNGCGTADSATAVVTVVPACQGPTITTQPQSVTVAAGTQTTLAFTWSGSEPGTIQWFVSSDSGWSAIADAHDATLTLDRVSASHSYYARVTNSCGSASTSVAEVDVAKGRHRAARH